MPLYIVAITIPPQGMGGAGKPTGGSKPSGGDGGGGGGLSSDLQARLDNLRKG